MLFWSFKTKREQYHVKVQEYNSNNSSRNGYQRVHDGNHIDMNRPGDSPQIYNDTNDNNSVEISNNTMSTIDDDAETPTTAGTVSFVTGGISLVSGSRAIYKQTQRAQKKSAEKLKPPKLITVSPKKSGFLNKEHYDKFVHGHN